MLNYTRTRSHVLIKVAKQIIIHYCLQLGNKPLFFIFLCWPSEGKLLYLKES